MNTKEHLLKMRELLADPKAWTTGEYARNEANEPCEATSSTAKKWCLFGASWRAGYELASTHVCNAPTLGFTNQGCVLRWNDDPDRTHAEVLAHLDSLIQNTK